jgi:hypothetical protein
VRKEGALKKPRWRSREVWPVQKKDYVWLAPSAKGAKSFFGGKNVINEEPYCTVFVPSMIVLNREEKDKSLPVVRTWPTSKSCRAFLGRID